MPDSSSAFSEATPVISQGSTATGDDVFYAAFQMSRMSLVLADPHQPDHPLVFCNQAFYDLTGYKPSEVIGRNCRFLQGRLTDPASVRVLREAVAAMRDAHVELWNYRKDGRPFWNSMFISPVFDREGRLIYWFGSQLDATARREAELAKAHARRLDTLGSMAAGIAHEFNNLMTVVVGSIESALAGPLNDRQAERLHRANRAARGAGRLTRQMLSFARGPNHEAAIVDLNDTLRDFDRLLKQVAGRNCSVAFDLTAEPVEARVDVGQLELALINLIRNASDAMVEGGGIVVRTRAVRPDESAALPNNAPAVEVAVIDCGSGIPSEVAARVTEPFFTTKTREKGTGLGLSMVQGFVEQSAGRMLLDTDEGRGTTVRLLFPRPVQTAAPV